MKPERWSPWGKWVFDLFFLGFFVCDSVYTELHSGLCWRVWLWAFLALVYLLRVLQG